MQRARTHISLALLAVASLLAGQNAFTQQPATTPGKTSASTSPKQYDARAFFATTAYGLASGFVWSPDDQKLLIGSDETGIFNAYALPAAGAGKSALTTSTTDSTFPVSWFPGDARVLVTADQGGNEISHLYVREVSGEIRDLTPAKNGKANFAGWSADDQYFYVLTNEREPKSFDLYRYAAKDYARTRVFQNDAVWEIGAISPDGRYVALVKPKTSADSDIYLLDTKDAKQSPQLITKHDGNVTHDAYEFTHKSKQLVYATDEHGEFTQAWTYDVASGRKAPLIKADWDVSFVTFSRSGNFRVWGVNEDARTAVHILDIRTGKQVTLPDLPQGDIAQVRFSRDENRLALMLSSDTSPSDVYTVDLKAGRSARLTKALNPQIRESDLVMTQVVRYKSFDGLQIPSILYRPRTVSPSSRVPALVWVHGGPGGQSRTGYSATIQHLVNHGYAVLAANNRGSSGYGKTFFHSDDKRHGDVDLKDIVYAKQYLASQDWIDSDEIVAAVRANGVPVEYVVFPDEGHGFTKRENRIKASDAFVTFLDAHLKQGGKR